ncbi:MAG: DUF4276 family protein [Deltaproteobacteria bacterium]|uniref:DUF4276 family protein n=1 Tax=Candidatus Zymogenus saltonus TaxID=2844893 RepID=A0A9D8KFJ0_9DELT|nr:DUF4276 family protein [Candidatus Zymogenus saltonus]
MCDQIFIYIAVEGQLDEAVLRTLLNKIGRFSVISCYGKQGKGYLKSRINGFNNAARGTPYLILTDLDSKECAPKLIEDWLGTQKHENLILRVAVREIEAWLLAHRSAFADFLGISVDRIPIEPDNLDKPKIELINISRKSRINEIRRAIVPREGSANQTGPNYTSALAHFVYKNWDAFEAAKNSPSLKRTIDSLKTFRPAFN